MADDNAGTDFDLKTVAGGAAGGATDKKEMTPNMDVLEQVTQKISEAKNVLIALSADPSVDELAAAIGLSLYLDRLDKRVTAIYSGATPNALEFLKPEKTFTSSVMALQDFVIALNKEKADHLRYRLDGEYVKIFITPYGDSISEKDLEFSYGDFNIDLVLALDVANGIDLDAALREHGRIMHDAMIINITNGKPGKLGEIEWSDEEASSVSEMVARMLYGEGGSSVGVNGSGGADGSGGGVGSVKINREEATAFLTGIVSATDRFKNENTTPATMTMASKLMESGADQQIISRNVAGEKVEMPEVAEEGEEDGAEVTEVEKDGALEGGGGDDISKENGGASEGSDGGKDDVLEEKGEILEIAKEEGKEGVTEGTKEKTTEETMGKTVEETKEAGVAKTSDGEVVEPLKVNEDEAETKAGTELPGADKAETQDEDGNKEKSENGNEGENEGATSLDDLKEMETNLAGDASTGGAVDMAGGDAGATPRVGDAHDKAVGEVDMTAEAGAVDMTAGEVNAMPGAGAVDMTTQGGFSGVQPETGATETTGTQEGLISEKPEKVLQPTAEGGLAGGGGDTEKYKKMLEDALGTPAGGGGAGNSGAFGGGANVGSDLGTNPAIAGAPSVSEKPEINGVPEMNFMPMPEGGVLPPPPTPPIDMGAPMPELNSTGGSSEAFGTGTMPAVQPIMPAGLGGAGAVGSGAVDFGSAGGASGAIEGPFGAVGNNGTESGAMSGGLGGSSNPGSNPFGGQTVNNSNPFIAGNGGGNPFMAGDGGGSSFGAQVGGGSNPFGAQPMGGAQGFGAGATGGGVGQNPGANGDPGAFKIPGM